MQLVDPTYVTFVTAVVTLITALIGLVRIILEKKSVWSILLLKKNS